MKKSLLILFVIFFTGCAMVGVSQLTQRFGEPQVQQREVSPFSASGQIYQHKVKPVLEQRCVVCHGCYDAPCQLKLSSPAGIDRGISQHRVYDGTRLFAQRPERLFIDANSTQQWRELGFSPVLNEREQSAEANLAGSLLYNSLLLKKSKPLEDDAILSDDYHFALDRTQQCKPIEQYQTVVNRSEKLGMPYGLPQISEQEFKTLETWLVSGAKMASQPAPKHTELTALAKWEALLNQSDLKSQLMARYIFEHWFLAHIYFVEDDPTFFKLVRSATPPGQPIKPIATRRPFDDPQVTRVYYRLWQEQATVLSKTHLPLKLDEVKYARIKAQFIDTPYDVTSLPSYRAEVASNPFKSFAQIPTKVKYQFMLDEAQLIIMGFIKGPVCRGQIALNVINDHFWVAFADPKGVADGKFDHFLVQSEDYLAMPAEQQSNALPVSSWLRYSLLQAQFLKSKRAQMNHYFADNNKLDLSLIWQGDGYNDNAALTIFRHFDSATVVKGFVGQTPKTMWVLDYSLFERIHYLLVAGFDVYGNIGHQLNTRLYMDFLRMEGEQNFLALLPKSERNKIHQHWYRNAPVNVTEFLAKDVPFVAQSDIQYLSEDVQQELYQKLKHHLNRVLNRDYEFANHADAFKQLNQLGSEATQFLPQVSFIMLKQGDSHKVFTLLRHNAHFNISSLLNEQSQRATAEDYVTLVPGFIGDYPGAIYYLDEADIAEFSERMLTLKTERDYQQLRTRFGVRRNDPQFWHYSDLLHQVAKDQRGIEHGLFDYNRLENR